MKKFFRVEARSKNDPTLTFGVYSGPISGYSLHNDDGEHPSPNEEIEKFGKETLAELSKVYRSEGSKRYGFADLEQLFQWFSMPDLLNTIFEYEKEDEGYSCDLVIQEYTVKGEAGTDYGVGKFQAIFKKDSVVDVKDVTSIIVDLITENL